MSLPKRCQWHLLGKKKLHHFWWSLMLALPIFPGSHPPSIVGVHELNFCVRDGNRWTLMAINTNLCRWLITIIMSNAYASNRFFGAPSGTRTYECQSQSLVPYRLATSQCNLWSAHLRTLAYYSISLTIWQSFFSIWRFLF